MSRTHFVLATIAYLIQLVHCEFSLNNIKLEALKPKGLRVTLPDEPGIEFVAFHGRLGKPLDIVELGDYSGEIQKPSDNAWTYENMDVQLKPGDELHYWVYVQFNRLGYRKDKQKWTVHELIPYEGKVCKPSDTTKNGKAACKGERILFDQFKSAISTSDWITEHYIPKLGPNFEFVSYRSRPENVFVRNQVLHLKPVPTTPDEQGLQILNLGDSCTSQNPEECWVKRESIVIIPPVTSGKVRSRISFKYGQIDIKARLPQGDWIYPIVQLQSTANPNASIWLAYARGNDRLTGADGDDIGSRTLFGGPVLSPTEPTRSELLRSHKLGTPYYTDVHTFGCKWEYGRIVLTVDDQQYGTIDTKNLVAFNKDEFYLTLGVGVGGINDFPEGFNSSGTPKPWINFHRRFVKTFSDAKDKWFPTWNGDQSSLQVDSVSVTAI